MLCDYDRRKELTFLGYVDMYINGDVFYSRCLLSRDFVRLGKWFVQPYDGDEEDVGTR